MPFYPFFFAPQTRINDGPDPACQVSALFKYTQESPACTDSQTDLTNKACVAENAFEAFNK